MKSPVMNVRKEGGVVTILGESGHARVAGADADGDQLWLRDADVEAATGWALKAEGFCRGEVCVPVPPAQADGFVRPGAVNVAALWRHMGKPVVHDSSGETWVLGEDAAARAERLLSLEATDFTLPDLDGRAHSLSDYRGKKVFLSTWASW